jgi:transposase
MKESKSNGLENIISQAIEEMKSEQGNNFSLERINLTELERRTGISRAKLRRLKANNFNEKPHGLVGQKQQTTVLSGYSAYLDKLLRQGITNSAVCLDRLREFGFEGSLSTVKRYIKAHKHLVPAKRQLVAPQGNRGRRLTTEPGEAYQMDWGFTKVLDYDGTEYTAACFAMVCHHCGQRYIEFFPNAKQESLFIGMLHAFQKMGVPEHVLTDNMKSVTTGRDSEGRPLWNNEYADFMAAVGFETRLCKPRHPFTKGAVERLILFVKSNFLAGRTFGSITDLNYEAWRWCDRQNSIYHDGVFCIPHEEHQEKCLLSGASPLVIDEAVRLYLWPERRLSFDGFVNYEGRRFGVPYSYTGKTCRVSRQEYTLYIYTPDLKQKLVEHNVTWSRRDSFCKDQYLTEQPEEFPTAPVSTVVHQSSPPANRDSFDRFNFDKEVEW